MKGMNLKFFDPITEQPLSVFKDKECTQRLPNPVPQVDGSFPDIFLDGKEWCDESYGLAFLDDKGREWARVSPLSSRNYQITAPWWRLYFGL